MPSNPDSCSRRRLHTQAQALVFTLLWLAPAAYTVLVGRAVPWLPSTLRFLTVLDVSAKTRPKAVDAVYVQVRANVPTSPSTPIAASSAKAQNLFSDAWVTLPWSDLSGITFDGVSSLEKILLTSLRYSAGEQVRSEASKFVVQRYGALYPQSAPLAAVRFVVASHPIGTAALAFPEGTWSNPPLELLQPGGAVTTRVLGTYTEGPATKRNNPSQFVAQPEFDDAALEAMIAKTEAIDFDLAGSKVTAKGLALLAKQPGLTGLRLADLPLHDADLAWLSQVATLARLDLTGTAVTDGLIPTLKSLPKLQELHVARTKLTTAAAPAIAAMHGLVVLDVGETELVKTALMQLGAWPKLRMLMLGRVDMEKQPLRAIMGHGLLSSLDLAGSIPGRGGLDGLRLFPMLQTLNLRGAKMVDSDLGPLTMCHNLSSLNLGDTGVSEKGVQSLLASLPKIKTIRWGRDGEKTARATKKTVSAPKPQVPNAAPPTKAASKTPTLPPAQALPTAPPTTSEKPQLNPPATAPVKP